MGFKLKYNDLTNFDFGKAFQKLITAPTDTKSAYMIKKIYNELDAARKQIHKEYIEDIAEKFAKRDESGKYDLATFVPNEDMAEAFMKAQEEFGNKEIFIGRHPLTMHDVRDVKLTALEQLALKDVLDDSSFDEIPKGPNVFDLKKST